MRYVGVYNRYLCFGGPEEGGWWYTWYEPIKYFRPTRRRRRKLMERLNELYETDSRFRNVNHGQDEIIVTERIPGLMVKDQVRPYYS